MRMKMIKIIIIIIRRRRIIIVVVSCIFGLTVWNTAVNINL